MSTFDEALDATRQTLALLGSDIDAMNARHATALAAAREEGRRQAFEESARIAVTLAETLVVSGERPSRDRDMRSDGYTTGAYAVATAIRALSVDAGLATHPVMPALESARTTKPAGGGL